MAATRRALGVLALAAFAAAVYWMLRAPSRGGSRRVIVVGLDGADWQLLDAYQAGGSMPQLARLVKEGRSGVLRTLNPPLSPLVWTTMMTGRSPLEHRILDFTRFHPTTGQREPITSDERRVKAVWEIAGDSDRDVAVFGLWATHPAEPVRGLMVSDRLFAFLKQEEAPPGTVHPPEEEKRILAARAEAERDVSLAALQAYLPWLTAAEYETLVARPDPYAHPVTALRRILVETRLYHRLASDWIRRTKPALSIVYIQGTDSIGHVFAAYAPPRQAEVSPEEFERYGRVSEAYFREVDALLGEYRALAEANDAALLVVSDHGFLWSEGRPTRSDGLARQTAGLWHRDEGIYLLWGRGVEPSATRGEGRVAQVGATILALLGLPRGLGLDGPALAGIAEVGPARDYGSRAVTARASGGTDNEEALEKLRALGYIGGAEPASRPAAGTGTRTGGSFNNEGLLLKDAGKRAEARAAFEQALTVDPDSAAAQYNLAGLLEAEGQSDRADTLLLAALEDGLGDGPRLVDEIATTAYKRGDTRRARRLLDGALRHRPDDVRLRLTRGRIRIEARDCPGALADFETARRAAPQLALAHSLAGTALLCLGRPAEARTAFERSLGLDPDQPRLRELLARRR
jgi:tetratricopeptide (TPR) repeat protein